MTKFKLPDIREEKTILKTIRIKYITLEQLERISKKTDISVNRLINECIEFSLNNLSIDDLEKI